MAQLVDSKGGNNKEAQEGLSAFGRKCNGLNGGMLTKANTFIQTYTWPSQRGARESTFGLNRPPIPYLGKEKRGISQESAECVMGANSMFRIMWGRS